MPLPQPPQPPIAIVGIGALLPGSRNPAEFWRMVVTGRDLAGVGIPAADGTERLALLVAGQALADVSGPAAPERTSVIIGTEWMEPAAREATFPGMLNAVVAGGFDLRGSDYTTDAAWASSLAAVSSGVDELTLGRADLVLTGGVQTGAGLVMFALKRLADAERDGNAVYGVIRGIGIASNGRCKATGDPSAGQGRALRAAYAVAGYGPETVELVEAHGAGDAAELGALRAVFDESGRADRQWAAVGSVTSQIGHTRAAAGTAGLLKAVLALHHKVLPPTSTVSTPGGRPELEGSPLYLNTAVRPWVRAGDHPRRASVSSFGYGGTNVHVAVEEYVPGAGSAGRRPPRSRTLPTELVLLSAPTADRLIAGIRGVGPTDLLWTARRSQLDFRRTDAHRLALTVADAEDLRVKLDQAVRAIEENPHRTVSLPNGVHYGAGPTAPGEVAFLFPGQASQYVGMGADVAMHFPQAQRAWDEAASVELGDRPLAGVVFPVPAVTAAGRNAQQELLSATEWTQPALAVQCRALLNVLEALDIRPDCVGGHSFGELVALHVAGVFDAETLLRLARRRGEAQRDAATIPGAMIAVAASREEIQAVVAQGYPDELWLANHNAPRQIIVSGTTRAIADLEDRLTARDVKNRRLNLASAYHSPIVASAGRQLLDHLAGARICRPRLPVFGNADAGLYPADPDDIRGRLAEHIAAPVRWVDEVHAMYARGVRTFVEVGAGGTLTKLVWQILDATDYRAVTLDVKGKNGCTTLQDALGQLAVHGVAMNLDPLWTGNPEPTPPAVWDADAARVA
ncbi:MAG TPA: acyltransferase domain-containing protein [Actinophytocola sp.]|uniref:acyltransferase domain-containing protein n=1 Tax=Actinophytocola sp. TaxID=1872138 RepID=UPI002DDD9B44|nr:acyltransferase domain-containing protein [Actinophytocola sp.]HEV2782799.1 acyltransferase domain-containing protein [Actinophytocola sp.]